jgi:hypothetical protein
MDLHEPPGDRVGEGVVDSESDGVIGAGVLSRVSVGT